MCTHNTKIVWKEISFISRVPNLGGLDHSCSDPFFSARHRNSLAPKKITHQSRGQKFPISAYLFWGSLSWPCKRVSILSGVCTSGFKSCHHLASALSLRVWGALPDHSKEWCRVSSIREGPPSSGLHVCSQSVRCSYGKREEAI